MHCYVRIAVLASVRVWCRCFCPLSEPHAFSLVWVVLMAEPRVIARLVGALALAAILPRIFRKLTAPQLSASIRPSGHNRSVIWLRTNAILLPNAAHLRIHNRETVGTAHEYKYYTTPEYQIHCLLACTWFPDPVSTVAIASQLTTTIPTTIHKKYRSPGTWNEGKQNGTKRTAQRP